MVFNRWPYQSHVYLYVVYRLYIKKRILVDTSYIFFPFFALQKSTYYVYIVWSLPALWSRSETSLSLSARTTLWAISILLYRLFVLLPISTESIKSHQRRGALYIVLFITLFSLSIKSHVLRFHLASKATSGINYI